MDKSGLTLYGNNCASPLCRNNCVQTTVSNQCRSNCVQRIVATQTVVKQSCRKQFCLCGFVEARVSKVATIVQTATVSTQQRRHTCVDNCADTCVSTQLLPSTCFGTICSTQLWRESCVDAHKSKQRCRNICGNFS